MFFLFGCITVEPDLKAGPVAVTPPVVHFPVLVYKEGVDVGNAAVQDIFHEGAETAVTAAADEQYLLASGEKLTQIAIVIPDDTSTGRLDPTVKAAQGVVDARLRGNVVRIAKLPRKELLKAVGFQIVDY